jgi:hypothetical protein
MQVETFLLADAASAPPDGKLYIHGGGITRINAPMLPFSLQLGVAVRLEVTEAELREPHTFALSFSDREGVAIHPPLHGKSGVASHIEPLAEGEMRLAQLALNVPGLTFTREGPCIIQFAIDGTTLHTFTLAVVATF